MVPPLVFEGLTLHQHQGYRFAVFKRQGGRTPELDQPGTLEWIGRFMGRMHAVGARAVMEKTPHVMLSGEGAAQFALSQGFKKQDLLTEKSRKAWEEGKKVQHQCTGTGGRRALL